MTKMTIAEYKKSKETPAIREWKRKWEKFYHMYEYAVSQYQSQAITFDTFMEKLRAINKHWRQDAKAL